MVSLAPLVLAALWMLVTQVEAAAVKKLPSYFRKCSLKDPNIDQCALKAGREVLPHLVHGDQSLQVPVLDPLVIPEIQVNTGGQPSSLDLVAKNIIIKGLTDAEIINVGIKPNIYTAQCRVPRLEIVSDYTVDGKVLVLPIKGNGKSNMTFENAYLYLQQPYTIEKRGDFHYITFAPNNATFNCSRAFFQLDNLFNGDETLGNGVNAFLNENWQEIVDALGQPFVDAASAVVRQMVQSIARHIPYENIFNDVEIP